MKSKRIIIGSIAIALVCLLASVFSFTGAWFTHTSDVKTATITVGAEVEFTVEANLKEAELAGVMPGDKIADFQSLVATIKDNTSDLYLRAYVLLDENLVEGVIDVEATGKGWVKVGDFFYYVGTEVVEEETQTKALVESDTFGDLQMLSVAENGIKTAEALALSLVADENATELDLVPGTQYTCKVVLQAVQAKNTGDLVINSEDGLAAWGAHGLEPAEPVDPETQE